jgi:hypothetical protein
MTIESLELPMWRGKQHTAYRPDAETAQYLMTSAYIFVGDGWCVRADTKDDIMQLAGYPEPWDTAVPQPWFDANRAGISMRGGWAVWWYGPASGLFGEPVFAEDAMKRAQQNVAALIVEALEMKQAQARFDALQHSRD